MLDEILAGIAEKLGVLFGEGIPRYVGELPEDVSLPCFCIRSGGITIRQLLGTRRQLGHPVDIQYLSASGSGGDAEIRAVQAVLLEGMEYITLGDGGLLRGTGMRCETADHVGHFQVNYNAIVRGPAPVLPFMETLDMKPKTKGGDSDGG